MTRYGPVIVLVILAVGALMGTALASDGSRSGFRGTPPVHGGAPCTTCYTAGGPIASMPGPTTVDAGTPDTYPMSVTGNSTGGQGSMMSDRVGATSLPIAVQNGSPLSSPTPSSITLQQVASGLSQPVVVTHAGDNRLFIAERQGRIRLIDAGGTLLSTPYLNIVSRVDSTDNEQGLLGLAFHPNYANNGYFYVYYIYEGPLPDPPGPTPDPDDRSRLSRFKVSAGNANQADANSELVLMEFAQPWSNHNGGDLHFGPDGYLYVASGDGGGSYWSSVGQAPVAQYGQNPHDLLGKMLRIDVNVPGGSPPPVHEGPDCDISGSSAARYRIPAGNAYTDGPGGAGCDEIWASGLRNPWRFSFDRASGAIWIADVGQSQWEEVNTKPSTPAGGYNFGWSCYEGNHFTGDYYTYFDNGTCEPAAAYDSATFEYSHATGDCSITGGFVYRSPSDLDLPGSYFYSDFCQPSIRTLSGNPGNLTSTEVLPASQFASPATFGENAIGDMFIANLNAGTVHRIDGTNPRPTSAIVKQAVTPPVIDGLIDPVWANANRYSMNNHVVRGSGVWFHQDLWSTYRALYDQDNLYFLIEVQDDVLVTDSAAWYDDDDVEIMIDGDRSGGNSYDGNNDFEFGFRWNDPHITPGVNSAPVPAGAQFALVPTVQGYAVEILLPLADMDILPVAGSTFGLDVHINDDDDGGPRDLKLTWYGATDDAWRYPSALSVATLDDGVAGACGLAGQNILFVSSSNPAASQDQALISHLSAAGYTITVRSQSQAVTGDAYGKSLVIVSDSVTSSNVNTKFRGVPVPVITWEPALFDDLGMTGLTDGTHYGNQSGQAQLSIANIAQPLTAGLAGLVTTSSSAQLYFWGVPASSADVAATLVGDPSRATIFGYEAGDLMVGLVAPARRVGFFNGIGSSFTPNGWALFDSAVRWAIGCGSASALTIIDATTNQAVGPLNDGDTINLAGLPDNILIRAELDPPMVGSVQFAYDNGTSVDNSAPYDYAGGGFIDWVPEVGPHRVTVTPFAAVNATGRQGQPLTVNFEVINQPLAVQISSFSATAGPEAIVVTWETVSEIDVLGFDVYRNTTPNGPQDLLAFVPAQSPGGSQGAAYAVHDSNVIAGQTYWYWLEVIAPGGGRTRIGPVNATVQVPTAVTLSQLGASATFGSPLGQVMIVTTLVALVAVIGSWSRRSSNSS